MPVLACRAAALTLRHLAERDARALLPARMEPSLFRALDAETDGEIAGQLRATLRTLLRTGVPSQPSYWLEVRLSALCKFNSCEGNCLATYFMPVMIVGLRSGQINRLQLSSKTETYLRFKVGLSKLRSPLTNMPMGLCTGDSYLQELLDLVIFHLAQWSHGACLLLQKNQCLCWACLHFFLGENPLENRIS